MPNAKDATTQSFQRILLVGPTGSGKTAQIWTLPGRKFAYLFDPNALPTLQGLDIEFEQFLPDFLEVDATLKGFNKGARDDKLSSKREPTVYIRWIEDINQKAESGFFNDFDWLCIDSLTFVAKAVMDRQLYINQRYGSIEDLGDYRVVGSKLSDVFSTLASLPINLFATGHLSSFQDEKTKKVTVQLQLPGKARNVLPLVFTNTWLAQTAEGEKGLRYEVRTVPEPRGLQDIRTSLRGLSPIEDVTIPSFDEKATGFGIGRLLSKKS